MLKTYAYLVFCVVAWGSNFVFGKILVQDFPPIMLTALRLFFIVLLLIGIALYQRRLQAVRGTDIIAIAVLGVVGVFLNQLSFFIGLQTADTTMSALVLATAPILTGILAAIFLKESFTRRMVLGSIVAIIGIFFLVTKGSFTSLYISPGLLWIVLTMLTFVVMILLTRSLAKRLDPLTVTLYSNFIGLVTSLPFVWGVHDTVSLHASAFAWGLLIVTGITVHGIATLVWNVHIKYVDASKASILSNLEPFVAMVMGVVLLSKAVTSVELIGSVFIVGGVMLSTYQRKRHKTMPV